METNDGYQTSWRTSATDNAALECNDADITRIAALPLYRTIKAVHITSEVSRVVPLVATLRRVRPELKSIVWQPPSNIHHGN
jgi:hypothetical protein